jgi:glycosyltransferase involved in cell wall biosynthesis
VRIAVFDYKTTRNNPIGGCHWRILNGLCRDHEFTVFALEFDNPCPERIRFVRVPAPKRPLALCYIMFHLMAPVWYFFHKLYRRAKFDLVQMVESNLSFGDVCYTQFCHRTFLRKYRNQIAGSGLAYRFRLLDHWLHMKMEPWVYRRVKRIIVASEGLARELKHEYPYTADKITIVSNPVELERMQRPADFDRAAFRRQYGLVEDDLVLAFVALGHFERKGLPQLLDAMKQTPSARLKLLAVGGMPDLIARYKAKCEKMGIAHRVVFAGMTKDVRPFLWASDAFTLPSFYEVFPLVALEAAAAALPLIVSPLNGVEEFLVDGQNGILVEPRAEAIDAGLRHFVATTPQNRAAIGAQAASSVRRYSLQAFIDRWRTVYAA